MCILVNAKPSLDRYLMKAALKHHLKAWFFITKFYSNILEFGIKQIHLYLNFVELVIVIYYIALHLSWLVLYSQTSTQHWSCIDSLNAIIRWIYRNLLSLKPPRTRMSPCNCVWDMNLVSSYVYHAVLQGDAHVIVFLNLPPERN